MKLNFLGYVFIILMIYLFSKTSTGGKVVQNSLVLILFILLLTNYQKIISTFTKEEAAG